MYEVYYWRERERERKREREREREREIFYHIFEVPFYYILYSMYNILCRISLRKGLREIF